VGLVHGDFHLGNVLVTDSGKIDRVIDWDLALTARLPLWDVLTLLSHEDFERGLKWSKAYGQAVERCFDNLAIKGKIAGYIECLELDIWDLLAAIATYPVVILSNKMRFGDGVENVVLDGLGDVLQTMRHYYDPGP
jgi:aminoglycoside phosphotransferase (APT) family kinase protein